MLPESTVLFHKTSMGVESASGTENGGGEETTKPEGGAKTERQEQTGVQEPSTEPPAKAATRVPYVPASVMR